MGDGWKGCINSGFSRARTKGRDRPGAKLKAGYFLAGREVIPRISTDPPNLLCCHQVFVKLLGEVCALFPSSWQLESQPLAAPSYPRSPDGQGCSISTAVLLAPGSTGVTHLLHSSASYCSVFHGETAFISPFLL